MSIINYIKAFFRKELTSIIAPLQKIHNQLDRFIDHTATDIQNNVKRIAELHVVNEAKKIEQEAANTVQQNIKKLLGAI